MKKLLLLSFLSVFILSAQAQVSITTAPDFTVTDHDGVTHNLYSYLDDGKHVILDLFTYWCGPCCTNTPALGEVFTKYGCNTADLIVIAVEGDGTVQQVEDFELNCGGGIAPVIVGTQDGGAVHQAYSPVAYPTIVMIAPDRSFVSQDIWPFSVAAVDALCAQNGIAETDCNATQAPSADYVAASDELEVSFTNNSTNGVSYLWDFGDGNTSTEENPTYTYAASGTYTVCLTVTAADGTVDTSCEDITVTASFAAAQASFTYLMNEFDASFTNNSANADSYLWNFGDGNSSTDENPSHTYATEGLYDVCLTASNAANSNVTCQSVQAKLTGIEDFVSESIELYPNPTKTGSQLNFQVNNATDVQIIIYDVIGAKVSEINTETYTAGTHSINLPVENLKGGQYFITLIQGSDVVKVLKLQKVQ